MVILPVGSGKGGVGKSLLATNLSIALAEAGRKVVLVDLDLGASNAHTMLGIRSVSRGIGTFLSVPRTDFDEIILPTEYDGLSFVPGDAEMPGHCGNLEAGSEKTPRALPGVAGLRLHGPRPRARRRDEPAGLLPPRDGGNCRHHAVPDVAAERVPVPEERGLPGDVCHRRAPRSRALRSWRTCGGTARAVSSAPRCPGSWT